MKATNVTIVCCHWPRHEDEAECARVRWDDGTKPPVAIGPNELRACWCFECLDAPEHGFNNPTMQRMILCPACGNKRCPRATDHRLACTGSNEPGQWGSRYGERITTSAKTGDSK